MFPKSQNAPNLDFLNLKSKDVHLGVKDNLLMHGGHTQISTSSIQMMSCDVIHHFFLDSFKHYKRHQNKVKVKGLGRHRSYLAGFSILFIFFFFMIL